MLPRSRGDLPAVHGRSRTRPEDTLLSEELLRLPDGGDHFWLKVRCQGLAHKQMLAAVARAAAIDPALVQSAGARDRQAVVQQWVSLPKAPVDNPGALKGAGYKSQLKVLEVHEGAGPIRAEQVSGLTCRLRLVDGAAEDGFERAQAILRRLRSQGVPNYIGAAMMGPSGSHARWGKLLAQGKRLPNRVPSSGPDRSKYERAWQARLFNGWVAQRLSGPGLDAVLPGDWLQTALNQGPAQRQLLQVEDAVAAQRRVESWESVVMGPLWGADCPPAGAQAQAFAEAAAAEQGPLPSQRCRGGLRALRFQPAGAQVEKSGKDLLVQCSIPCDAFAAVLAEELLAIEGHLS